DAGLGHGAVRTSPEKANLQTVGGRGDGPRAPADVAGWPHHDMLTQYDFWLRKSLEQPVSDHRLGAARRFFRRLEHRHNRAMPSLAGACEQRGRSNQPSYMHVVTA